MHVWRVSKTYRNSECPFKSTLQARAFWYDTIGEILQHVADWQEQILVVETVIEDSVFVGPFLANRPRRGLNCVIFILKGGTEIEPPVSIR